MDKIRDIQINEAVIHVLDNNSDEPILNNYMLDLTEEVYKFILSHLERVLKDDNLKCAFFKEKGTPVKIYSQEYLDGRMDLNSFSKEAAGELFEIMETTEGIPSCDLLVVSFNTEYGPMIGLLKIDYIKQYTHKVNITDNNVDIRLQSIITGLSDKKKVQKCAFIRPIHAGQDYDLLVLDKKPMVDEDGANYFLDTLLGCNLINNDRDYTRAFMALVEVWTRSNFKEEAFKAEKLRSSVKRVLRDNEDIDIYELAEEIILPNEPEVKKDFIAYLQAHNIERFKVDKEYLDKKLSNVKIKVSSAIALNITGDAYADINKFEIVNNGDGSINMVIKHIENYVEG
ncbi:nucleoid-associated protein [Clostridium estertheticum]|uniref:Nucleoid-associated protein n=1 Tax=Clostridium estertheticum TaxID=238834 RepID=A0AA47EJ85_9CLOT|nr:nucleoid-associated protein [Clostridium estertheticum]MBU3155160.1 nucleoid-associated protein [Clostridium estertheticum]WAG61214.1 nucleoid-associated protein [Clostridium estertheticum]